MGIFRETANTPAYPLSKDMPDKKREGGSERSPKISYRLRTFATPIFPRSGQLFGFLSPSSGYREWPGAVYSGVESPVFIFSWFRLPASCATPFVAAVARCAWTQKPSMSMLAEFSDAN